MLESQQKAVFFFLFAKLCVSLSEFNGVCRHVGVLNRANEVHRVGGSRRSLTFQGRILIDMRG